MLQDLLAPRATRWPHALALVVASGVTSTARAVPDLAALEVTRPGAGGGCSSLELDALIDVTVLNAGTTATAVPVEILVFEDLNANGTFDVPGDQALGTAVVAPALDPGATATVTVSVIGVLRFRDAPLHAWVDAADVLAEPDEDDNFADTRVACSRPQPTGAIEPVLEWEWTGAEVATAPLVGDVNADGTPDVVFASDLNLIHVLDGRTGAEIWRSSRTTVSPMSTPAIGDIDGDPGLEIIALKNGLQLVALDDDGSELWVSADMPLTTGSNFGGITLADLNCDGSPEALFQTNAVRTDTGALFWTAELGGTWGLNFNYPGFTAAVDVDANGIPELIAGPTAYGGGGSILWRQTAINDGFTAIGQFDEDPAPEIAVVHVCHLWLIDGDGGSVIWDVELPLGGGGCDLLPFRCGPPAVGDVDGDGAAELIVAGADWFVVYEADGSIKWQVPTSDCSSSATSSTIFDFDGDGALEVVYQDELDLHVYRGADGFELARVPSSSRTVMETVTIADVDGDHRAEIITPLNHMAGRTSQGIRVYGDRDDGWVNTRRIWNQSAYRIDAVNDDGTIPPDGGGSCAEAFWTTHGTYRVQSLPEVPLLGLPDLTLTVLEWRLEEDAACNRTVVVDGRVGNAGAIADGRPVEVWIHDGDPAAGGATLDHLLGPDLAPGEWWDFSATVQVAAATDLHVTVGDDGVGPDPVNECRLDNNRCVLEVRPVDPPPPERVGPVLLATGHGRPGAPLISADFTWEGDEGLPRPAGDHYHVLRATTPDELLPVPGTEPWTLLTWRDETDRAVTLPWVHFYRVLAANVCDIVE